jgi:hypothetical protein
MRKIVINDCYGGFGLSAKAIARYLELNGKKAFFFNYDSSKTCARISEEEAEADSILCAHVRLTDDASKCGDREFYFFDFDIPRDDKFLIQVLEEMGEAAASKYANLKIVEIPEDVEWEIKEYDGAEWVAEKHRTWR